MSSPVSATPPLHPSTVTEQILDASGVPLITWRLQLPKLQHRQGVLADELQPSVDEELADRWTRLLEWMPHLPLARIIAASGTISFTLLYPTAAYGWKQEKLRFPSWAATLQLLSHVSEEELKQWTRAQVAQAVQQTLQQKQIELDAVKSRIQRDGAALMLLEAQSDLPSDLVNIVAQYVNSDFERPHAYGSIYAAQQTG